MIELIADTNIFLRLILNDVPKQAEEVEKLLRQAKKGEVKLLVPQIIIFEVEFALSKYYKFSKNQIIDKLKSIVSTQYFHVQDEDIFKRALKLYEEEELSLVDCFLISKSQIFGMKIFTFDKDLKKLNF